MKTVDCNKLKQKWIYQYRNNFLNLHIPKSQNYSYNTLQWEVIMSFGILHASTNFLPTKILVKKPKCSTNINDDS